MRKAKYFMCFYYTIPDCLTKEPFKPDKIRERNVNVQKSELKGLNYSYCGKFINCAFPFMNFVSI